ncbi:MAG: aminotransferase class III-fold pyridoxal phosphate-dependent enzyme [Bermanella sp.]
MMNYKNSLNLFDRAIKSIPVASQTFSKSHYSIPKGGAPLFLEKGKGDKVWDVDGNEYIDQVNGLLSVSIGYCDDDVDSAIKKQLKNGINFSLPHRLECEVAEKIIEIIPSAEMVRFGKNGTDVTSAAVRLARAYTNKNRVAICGYHGWQDWYIGITARNLGVPKVVSDLSVTFNYNDLESLENLFTCYSDIGSVILEPMAAIYPSEEFLTGVRDLCNKYGAILIFDEMITGFRLHKGGAQALFGVTPDLSTFGKGMANGMPVSAIVGRKDIMEYMDKIFFSGTFGGETLSLAAASCVLDKYINLPVTEHFYEMGKMLTDGIDILKLKYDIDFFNLIGHESWKVFSINHTDDLLIKSIIIENLAKNGVLTIGSHNMSYSTNTQSIIKILSAYDKTFSLLTEGIRINNLNGLLSGDPIKPVFKVR